MQTLSKIEQGSLSTIQGREAVRWDLELHPEGGLLVSDGARRLLVGDAIELSLCLTTGARVQFSARVRCLANLAATGEVGAWIELTDLNLVERREFRRWQAQIRRERGTERIPVEVECKVRFRRYTTPSSANWSSSRPCH